MKTTIKSFKILVLLVGIFFGVAENVNAQESMPFKYDPTPFVGKWVASSGDRTFELTIEEYRHFLILKKRRELYMDLLVGEMIYKTNGEITRHIKIDGLSSIFTGSPSSTLEIDFKYHDKGRKVGGEGYMTLSPEDPHRATWKLKKGGVSYEWPLMFGEGWQKADFDIPKELEWTKVE